MSSAFHPQTDGATERANRTVTQMIRQCVSPNQKDWVTKLPAIEFAINSARSSTTGFSPFQLNYGRNPSPMIWQNQEEFPGVRKFAEQMKMAIMSAHNSIIVARIVNTVQANRKRNMASYKVGDLVYLSTKNISLPKGRARKLAPKYLGPFEISKILKEGATYQLDLSDELLKRGINRSFHASLLKPHVPNDDRKFPGRLPSQIPGFGEKPDEWIIEAIISHHGKGINSEFEIQWKAGDRTWSPYREVAHLIAMDRYCELMGVEGPHDLPAAYPKRENASEISVNSVRVPGERYISRGQEEQKPHLPTTPTMSQQLSYEEWSACAAFAHKLDQFLRGNRQDPPGQPPPRYRDYLELIEGPHSNPNTSPAYPPPYGPPAPAQSNTVSMPPESLNSFLDAQVRMMELAVGRGGPRLGYSGIRPIPRYNKPFRPSYNRGGCGRGRGTARGGRFGRARPSLSRNKTDSRTMGEDVSMTELSLFPDMMNLFAASSSGIPGPSSSTAPTPVSVATTAQLAMTPGLTRSTHMLARANSNTEIEEIAEQLANDMGGIDIGDLMCNEGSAGTEAKGKGKEVMKPEAKPRDGDFE